MDCVAVLVSPNGWGNSAALLLLVICLVLDFFILVVYSLGKKLAQRLAGQEITLRLESESITFQSPDTSLTMKWSAIERVLRYPDGVLIKLRHQPAYRAIPLYALGEEILRFIETKANQSKVGQIEVC